MKQLERQLLAGLLGILWLASGAVNSCWATTITSTRSAIASFYAAARTCSRQLHLTSTTRALFAQLFSNYALCFYGPIIPEIMPVYYLIDAPLSVHTAAIHPLCWVLVYSDEFLMVNIDEYNLRMFLYPLNPSICTISVLIQFINTSRLHTHTHTHTPQICTRSWCNFATVRMWPTFFLTWDSNSHLLITPAWLMRHHIGWNISTCMQWVIL